MFACPAFRCCFLFGKKRYSRVGYECSDMFVPMLFYASPATVSLSEEFSVGTDVIVCIKETFYALLGSFFEFLVYNFNSQYL